VLSNLSKSYISQVKSGKRPPSQQVIQLLDTLLPPAKRADNCQKAIGNFIKSRREGTSPNTIRDYRNTLCRSLKFLGLTPKTSEINRFLQSLSCTLGGKYGYYKCLRAFYNWLYSPKSQYTFRPEDNPITWVEAPKRPVVILPALTVEQVQLLLEKTECLRDKAIISLFVDSGLRLSELTNTKVADIHWDNRTIHVIGKGNKEALAPFGALSEDYLRQWLSQYKPKVNLWGLNEWGVVSMLRRLRAKTGISCNAHVFRRTFAVLLRKAGIDTMTIKELGRWESLEMVQRYTRSFSFQDSMKFYKSPLS
jgi:site-specific recombinase XerD